MEDNWLSSQPSYEGITSALRKKLEEDEIDRQRQIQQTIGIRGIRSSGIGMYPTQEAGRIRGNEEAGIYSAVGGQQLGNIFTSQQNDKDRALQIQLQNMKAQAAQQAAQGARRSTWLSTLWGIPASLITSGGSNILKGLINKWQTPNENEQEYDPETMMMLKRMGF